MIGKIEHTNSIPQNSFNCPHHRCNTDTLGNIEQSNASSISAQLPKPSSFDSTLRPPFRLCVFRCVLSLTCRWTKQKLLACRNCGEERIAVICFGLMLCKVGDITIPLYLNFANLVRVRLKLFTKKLSRTLGPRRFHCSAAHERVGVATQGTDPLWLNVA